MALVRPRSPFVSTALGYDVVLSRADILEDDHPHVTAHPDCFEPVRATITSPVEQATAAPGERRNIRRG
jgi:hypothetical protein